MRNRIEVIINKGASVWMSPTIDGQVKKMHQNFSVEIRKAIAADNEHEQSDGPGDVPHIILRDFNRIVTPDVWTGIENFQGNQKWNVTWIEGKDLSFSYSDSAPFEDGIISYSFTWSDFYTLAQPDDKRENITVEAYGISDCADGVQGVLEVFFAYPAHIISFRPDEEKSTGIVDIDLDNNECTVIGGERVVLNWTGAADYTHTVSLRENGKMIESPLLINDSFEIKKMTEKSVSYELSVKNSYDFPDIRTFNIKKARWENKGQEGGIFQDDIYSSYEYNPRIHVYNGTYYAYLHPFLYRRNSNGEWIKITQNNLYNNTEYVCNASYLYNGILNVAGYQNSRFSFFLVCYYDMANDEWKENNKCFRIPTPAGSLVVCGFAASKEKLYLYNTSGNACLAYTKSSAPPLWFDDRILIECPQGISLINATMHFWINKFYIAIIGKEMDGEDYYALLYDEDAKSSNEYLMRLKLSGKSRTAMLLEMNHKLWLATDKELIDCDLQQIDNKFYPPVEEDKSIWLGSDGESIFGVFPDKNLWRFTE